jgi:cytochrome c-type biogenesis protein CcmH/NrfF
MRDRLRLRSKVALVALFTSVLLTGSVPLQNPRVRSVGELLSCQCGCGASITSCNMQNCHSASPIRERLLQMVEAGESDEQILTTFEQEYGKIILRKPPARGFFLMAWVMPFIGLGGGLAVVWFVLQRLLARRPATAGASAQVDVDADSPDLARYRDRIERELDELDGGPKK